MKFLGWTAEELRLLMNTRSLVLKMFHGANADQEVRAWVKRGGAEVIQLDDFRHNGRRHRPKDYD
jgi:hypothetical protein